MSPLVVSAVTGGPYQGTPLLVEIARWPPWSRAALGGGHTPRVPAWKCIACWALSRPFALSGDRRDVAVELHDGFADALDLAVGHRPEIARHALAGRLGRCCGRRRRRVRGRLKAGSRPPRPQRQQGESRDRGNAAPARPSAAGRCRGRGLGLRRGCGRGHRQTVRRPRARWAARPRAGAWPPARRPRAGPRSPGHRSSDSARRDPWPWPARWSRRRRRRARAAPCWASAADRRRAPTAWPRRCPWGTRRGR